MTFTEFAKANKLRFHCREVSQRNDGLMTDMEDGSRHYVYAIGIGGDFWPVKGTMTKGSRLEDGCTLEEVLECLQADVTEDSFEEWADDFGYDHDSRRAHKIWTACVAQTANLRRLLGDNFDAFMEVES